MNQYLLRIALLRAGYTPAPCHSGRPVVFPSGEVSESSILAWQNINAPETGIYNRITGEVTIVDSVPLSAAELEARRVAQEAELAARRKAEKRDKMRVEREADRRARGVPTRAVWLQAHSQDRDRVWEKFPMSRAKWYRLGKPAPEIGGVESPYPGLHVQSAQSSTIKTGEKTDGEVE